ncbi:uncharacterized protein LOC114847484 [Betta splendens]|uniref:Uncharacterized protein LOC114847484 n=1 Tax=Betta splendens TaxID=158456 RepID=A0A6P7LFV4_BETSP|nr:uncharacterized protein LOC114847484 [Betta splendens]
MLLVFLSIQLFVRVLSEATLAPPYHIRVKSGVITWSPAAEDTDVHYTVQYRRFGSTEWENVSHCFNTSFISCNVTFTKEDSESGCVGLRVQAERRGLTSRPVEACSRLGDTCSPEVNLTSRPGSLTAYLRINSSMVHEYGGHIQNRVYYGKEGETLEKNYKDGASSVSIYGLEEGSLYCVKVQYLLDGEVLGTDSCIQCERIPQSAKGSHLTLTLVLVGVLAGALVILTIVYVLIFHLKTIKLYLQPPYTIPEHFLYRPTIIHLLSSPTEDMEDVRVD